MKKIESKYFGSLLEDIFKLNNEATKKISVVSFIGYDKYYHVDEDLKKAAEEPRKLETHIKISFGGITEEINSLLESDIYKKFIEKYKDDLFGMEHENFNEPDKTPFSTIVFYI